MGGVTLLGVGRVAFVRKPVQNSLSKSDPQGLALTETAPNLLSRSGPFESRLLRTKHGLGLRELLQRRVCRSR